MPECAARTGTQLSRSSPRSTTGNFRVKGPKPATSGCARRDVRAQVALAESINGLCKTELIKRHGPWRTADAVELATAEYVDWSNHRRPYESCGDIPPAEREASYYAHEGARPSAELSQP